MIKKVRNTVPWTYVIHHLQMKKFLESFTKTSCKKKNQKELRIEKVKREKVINYMLNGKDTIICLIVGSIKKTV